MSVDIRDLNAIVRETNRLFADIQSEIRKIIVGQDHLIERLLIGLLADGHILLEGVPGLAKTLAVKTLAQTLDCHFQRIQFTPDLLPSDLIGTSIYNPKEGTFHVQKGPVFTNILLADEINRAPAKVQSALLEVMAEKQVTISGETFKAEEPYLVLATQNPIEQEGTYPLPEAQTDRFMMKVKISYPTREEEKEIVRRVTQSETTKEIKPIAKAQDILKARNLVGEIYVDDKVMEYILNITFATREPRQFDVPIEGLLEYGASPRASIALSIAARSHAFLQGRGFVTPHDVKMVGPDILRHRLILSYEAQAENVSSEDIIDSVFETLLVP